MSLPRPLTSLVGRETELSAVRAFLAHARLLTITGPGGVGKTRVAIAAAANADFPDGVLFVDLAPLHDPRLVHAAIALALGVRDGAGTPLLDRIADAIGARRLLLVLDNCEQVADAATDLARLLSIAPNFAILATSGCSGAAAVRAAGLCGARQLRADRQQRCRGGGDLCSPGWAASGH